MAAYRIAESRFSRARRRSLRGCLSQTPRRVNGRTPIAQLSIAVSIARYPERPVFVGARERGARRGGCADQRRACAKSHADRARPFTGGAIVGRPGGAATRSRARERPGRPTYQTARSVSLRAMRVSRQAILLALPRLPEMGDVHAAPDRYARRLCVSGLSKVITTGPSAAPILGDMVPNSNRPYVI